MDRVNILNLTGAAILISLPFSCTPAPAEELVVSIRSYHFFEQDTNNNNLGLHYIANNGFTVGAYHNSYYELSVLLGYSFPLYKDFGMSVGVVSGYDKPITKNPYFAFHYHHQLDKNWSVVYTVGALAVINLGFSYTWSK
jgi:hypothetical protein